MASIRPVEPTILKCRTGVNDPRRNRPVARWHDRHPHMRHSGKLKRALPEGKALADFIRDIVILKSNVKSNWAFISIQFTNLT